MKVRLKTGQFVTLTPEVVYLNMGIEEPEKLLKWKNELTNESIALKRKEQFELQKDKKPEKEENENNEEAILKQLKNLQKEIQKIRQERNMQGEEFIKNSSESRGGVLKRIFKGKAKEDEDGDNAT